VAKLCIDNPTDPPIGRYTRTVTVTVTQLYPIACAATDTQTDRQTTGKVSFCLWPVAIWSAEYRVGHKSLTTLCKSQSMRNRWITTICDLIKPRGKSLGGVTLTAAIF